MPDAPKKTCFVVMGFGEKTDYQQQKTFDLDKSYRIIIKKAVEAADLECIRADDIVHAGIIDKPMYEMLLNADVVVADLSTSNANAIYELGVRHALRPHTTIVIAESGFKFPFDIGHLLIRPYEHMGKGIDSEEGEKACEALTKALKELTAKLDTDSPVYTFLPTLNCPSVGKNSVALAAVAEEAAASAPVPDQSVSMLMDMFLMARRAENWEGAKLPLDQLKLKRPGDPFIVQQLAFVTYQSKKPDKQTAFTKAKEILSELNPKTSNDAETLGIWGAIHKRLWELNGNQEDLEESVRSYGKGYSLKEDYYNGINYAFMLNVRAGVQSSKADAIADFVWARRVRERVIELCNERLAAGVKDDAGNVDRTELFWVRATLIEALLGTGKDVEANALKEEAIREAPESWMAGTLQDQLAKLEKMLANSPLAGL